jgi:sterol desaturase/sphingolipid hydroxylase (fatty acid hydroxylase superfamily)
MEIIPGPAFPLAFFAAFALERLLPRRAQPRLRVSWALLGVLFFFIAAAIRIPLPAAIAALLGGVSPIDLSGLPMLVSVPLVMLVTGFFGYWLHRATHRSERLWRWSHQMHHAAERVDIAGFAYTHPIDHLLAVLASAPIIVLLGIAPDAAAVAGFIGFVLGLFEHMDLRTPRWLGWVIFRPEQHAVHHQRGVHAYNYGGLPIFDMLFGTFRNPETVDAPFGFWDGASHRVLAMLRGRDVSTRA